MTERCYNCGKEEEIKNGISNIEKIETNLKEYSDKAEKFMPLCEECVKKWAEGKLEGIEEKWIAEKNKSNYSTLESGILECNECGKELPVGVPYYSVCVNKEKEVKEGEVEVLEAEALFTYCEDCFKKIEVVIQKK